MLNCGIFLRDGQVNPNEHEGDFIMGLSTAGSNVQKPVIPHINLVGRSLPDLVAEVPEYFFEVLRVGRKHYGQIPMAIGNALSIQWLNRNNNVSLS